jgi:phospholipase/lecithinase/hemolysin
MGKLSWTAILIAPALLVAFGANATVTFTQVVVFGDSTVDSGNYKSLSNPGGSQTYNSLWASAVAAGAGAPTTNPDLLNSQILARFFGLKADPSNAGGTNYADSGAKNVTVNTAQTGGFTAAVPTVTQISNYISGKGGAVDPQALYYIASGGNDVSYAIGGTGTGPYPANPTLYVTQAADQLAAAIENLHAAGAQYIIVNGLDYSFPKNNSTEMALRGTYTQRLWTDLTAAGVPYHQGDANSVHVAAVSNPSQYGLISTSNAAGNTACAVPNGVTSAWALLCSSNPSAPSSWVAPNADLTYLFADDQHYATVGQSLKANYLYRLIVPYSDTHDFNGHGSSDILLSDAKGNLSLWLTSGTEISQQSIGTASTAWSIVGQRDFNDDGRSDILWRDSSGNVGMWLMNGAAVKSTSVLGNVPTTWSVVGTGDFNGDGYGDILWRDTLGNIGIWFMNGTTVAAAAVIGNVPTAWTVVGCDMKGDIFWRNTNTGDVGLWVMAGTQVSQSVGFGPVPLTWSIAGIGDFDNNGSSDILWRDNSGNVGMWLMSGASIQSSGGLGNVASNWSIKATGDYNGDGKSDVLWTDNSGNVGVWFMDGNAISSTQMYGNAGASSVQALNAD